MTLSRLVKFECREGPHSAPKTPDHRILGLLRLLTCASLLCWELSAHVEAFVFVSSPPTVWPNGTIPMDLQLGGTLATPLMDGSTSWNSVATNALATWNLYINTVKFTVYTQSPKAPADDDRINQVFFDYTFYGQSFGVGVLALTSTWRIGTTRTEGDTVFNLAMPWNSYRGNLLPAASGGTLFDFQRVALHEFGHTLGLGHPDLAGQSVLALMNSRTSDLDHLVTDDTTGAFVLYGELPPSLPPSIVIQPQSQTVTAGSTVTFSVAASGSQPLSYQWWRNGGSISGATSASYSISNVQTNQAGNYTVVVSNASGTATSAIAGLIVNVPPSIAVQPQNQTVTAGNSVAFSVTASGTAPLSYQWYRNSSAIAGVTATRYTISATQPSDAGDYKVRVSNVAGNADSPVATLTVQFAPLITGQPQSQTVIVGDIVTFTVAADGVPAPSYQWRFKGNPIPSASQVSYTVAGVRTNDAGNYSVTVSNALRQTNSAPATLTVLVPFPGIYNTGLSDSRTLLGDGQVDPHYKLVVNPNNPASSSSLVQDSTAWPVVGGPWIQNSSISKWIGPAFNTVGAATGNYIYQLTLDLTGYDPRTAFLAGSWATDDTGSIFLNGVDTGFGSAGFAAFSTFTLTNGFVLGTNLIEFRVPNAAGPTGLRVENLRGTAKKATVPFVGTQPEGATKVIGNNVTFAVVAGGASPLSYQWRFKGADIPTATGASLTLTNLQLSRAGNYAVIVTNAFGRAVSSNAVLMVNPPPACVAPPSGLVGWWPGNGNANDSAGTNNGTLQNGSSCAPGLVGQAFSFDGIDDVVQVPSSPSLSFVPQAPMTVELWAYRTGSASAMHILGKRNGCGADPAAMNYQMYFNVPSGQGLGFGGGGGAANSGLDMPMNTWTHLAGRFDGSNFCLYVNGGLVATHAGTLGPQNTAPLLIGGSGDCAKFAGLIDEVSVYSRALSDGEIGAIYNAGRAGKCGLPPVILSPPQGQTVVAGVNVTFGVTAAGTPPLSYQWRLGSKSLSGATTNSYMIASAQATDAGSYDVIVSNNSGSVTSAMATLTVWIPPAITQQPVSLVVTEGSSASFSVRASGDMPLSYQWRLGSKSLSGATTNSYTIASAQAANGGSYDVIVSNNSGSVTSAVATLMVRIPPAITQEPVSLVVTEGSSASFSVSASGDTPLSYQWKCNGLNISGATSATYTISNVQTNQAGNYTVTISNAVSQTNSADAALTVLVPFPGICSTGLSDSRTLLADDQVDPHYKLVVNPNNPAASNSVVQDSTQFPIVGGPWVPNSSKSKWIGPALNTSGAAAGNYSYQLTVDLTGYDPRTAFLAGSWAADDGGSILLNGVDTGFSCTNNFVSFSMFTLTNGFVSGTNLIEFRVSNGGYWTGLRVEDLRGTVLAGVTVTQPTLTVSRAGNGIRVAWPVSAAGFVLQETSSPAGSWTNSSAAVVVQGNENVALIATTGTAKFYRLRK